MYETIKNFHTQFAYEPTIENSDTLGSFDTFIVAGMGGSHLAADLLKIWNPSLDLIIHTDYGLPALPDGALKRRLVIVSSYSGNTEEAIDAYREARRQHFPVAVIAAGGTLLDCARDDGIPHVVIPDSPSTPLPSTMSSGSNGRSAQDTSTSIAGGVRLRLTRSPSSLQPRMALGLNFRALLTLMGETEALAETATLAQDFDPSSFEEEGKSLAKKLEGSIPVMYSSNRNAPIAYNWKIKCNETGKIPAFHNTLPELNHNEMTGFDVKDTTRDLSGRFHFILLKDSKDHPRIQKRMEILRKLYEDRGLPVTTLLLEGKTILHKIFSSLILADWTAYYLAEQYGVESEEVPMVEEFKKLIQ